MDVKKIILRILNLLVKLRIVYGIYELNYKGKGVSLNQFYSAGHWSSRYNLKKKYKSVFFDMFNSNIKDKFFDKFALIIFYNSRHDPDNVTGFEKLFMDSLKSEGFIIDDSKKYYKFFAIVPDESLEKNEFKFVIINIK